ncbi:MAG: YdiU family protein [Gammaproteobacteria bacterium]|nr:YdiU family protein [Gammaproteobacteria bacterium]
MPLQFDNSYAQLPDRFYTRLSPVPVSSPGPIRVNRELAQLLGIDADWLASATGTRVVAGNELPEGAEPIATVYAGHQFGSWNPRLGDGRAILLGEVIAGDGERYDIQLKGSGITPYSRNGDGRAPLGPVLREYIVSEAMAALGIPTSRSLAAVTTGEQVYREQPLAGAILARVAKSHIRVGTLQYFASVGDVDGIRLLVDHVIERHYPEAADADTPVLAMYENIIRSQAELIAHWQSIGFIHGVMNTDNMLLSGETIDYGPCAFMDRYDSAMVFSSIDHGGRYAYRNQPAIAHWNLAALGNSLLPLLDPDQEKATEIAQNALNQFPDLFFEAFFTRMRAKLGLITAEESDTELVQEWLDLLERNGADFTLAFRRLAELPAARKDIAVLFDFDDGYTDWLDKWRARCARESPSDAERGARMLATNPALIPRNHLVEAAIEAGYAGDFEPFHRLADRLAHPFDFGAGDIDFARPPRAEEVVQQTFCGT